MIADFLGVPLETLIVSANQTLYMVGVSLVIGTLIAVPLALILTLTREDGIYPNSIIYFLFNGIINIIRSIPFIILLVFIMPLTKILVGTRIGSTAAIVPLVFYIAPYISRLIENSLLEVSKGIIEAAQSMGATVFQIVWHFMLPEAKASIILSLTTGIIGLIGATAMAGSIGGGGVGDLSLTYGYQRFNNRLMITTVIVLIIFVQLIQHLGNTISRKIRTHQ